MSDNYDKLLKNKISGAPEKKEEPAPKPKSKRSPARRALVLVLALVCAAGLLVCAAGVLGYRVSVDRRILPNTYVEGIAVGGLTREEADKALREAGFGNLEGEMLSVTLPAGAAFSVDYLRSGAILSRESAINLAYAPGHGTNVFSNLRDAVKSRLSPTGIQAGEQTLDEAYVRECVDAGLAALEKNLNRTAYIADLPGEKLILFKGAGGIPLDRDGLYTAVTAALKAGEKTLWYDKLTRELPAPDFETLFWEIAVMPEDAYYTETFEVVPEVVGYGFDLDEAKRLWDSAKVGEQVIVPLITARPAVTAAELEAALYRDLLGSQQTYYYGSTPERINNIRLAASKLDGLILLPGETFSYNDTVGQRTQEAGFQYADAYSDGQVVAELGGGICQVSSTLYSATMYARLKTVVRQNHYFKVGYLDYGLDATVSWRQPDFKFRNNFDYPIKLAAYLNEDDMSLAVEIWGTDLDGITVRLYHTEDDVFDEELPWVLVGKSVHTYGDLYDADGNYLETVHENSGIYYFHDEDIDWPEGYERGGGDAYL
ncbi:MAG: VanW family protein [Oscillospiraceae bacterium]|nr:VanW family protein [Oscillospiraceae bacterium]